MNKTVSNFLRDHLAEFMDGSLYAREISYFRDNSFINFVSKSNLSDSELALKENKYQGIELDFDFDIDTDAEIEVILDRAWMNQRDMIFCFWNLELIFVESWRILSPFAPSPPHPHLGSGD